MASVRIEPLSGAHCESVLELVRANQARFRAGALTGLPDWADAYPRWLGAQIGSMTETGSPVMRYGIVDPNGALLGIVGIDSVRRFHGAGVWYCVDTKSQGRGLVKTAVLQAMLHFSERLLERDLKAPPRWVLHALPANTKSLALARSLGFEREEMLDYTRHDSARGPGKRLLGHLLECSTQELRSRVRERELLRALKHSKEHSKKDLREDSKELLSTRGLRRKTAAA